MTPQLVRAHLDALVQLPGVWGGGKTSPFGWA